MNTPRTSLSAPLAVVVSVWLLGACIDPLTSSPDGATSEEGETDPIGQGVDSGDITRRCQAGHVPVQDLGLLDEDDQPSALLSRASQRLSEDLEPYELEALTRVDWTTRSPDSVVVDPLLQRAATIVAPVFADTTLLESSADCGDATRSGALCDGECYALIVAGASGLLAVAATALVCVAPDPTFSTKLACVALISAILAQAAKGSEFPPCGDIDQPCCPETPDFPACVGELSCTCANAQGCDDSNATCQRCGHVGEPCCEQTPECFGDMDEFETSCVDGVCCEVSNCPPGAEECQPSDVLPHIPVPYACLPFEGACGTVHLWTAMDRSMCLASSLYDPETGRCCR